jgi:hypothetical protein
MTARNALIKYVDNTLTNLTQNNQYEVIAWLGADNGIRALILDDTGAIFTANNVQDPTLWSVTRI